MDYLLNQIFESFTYVTWWIAGLLLVISEIFIGGSFLLWLGVSSFVVGGLMLLGIDLKWELQFSLFAIVSLLLIIVWIKFFKKKTEKTTDNLLSKRADKYIGRTFIVVEAIENGVGKVSVEDTRWRVLGEDSPVKSKVKVVSVEGSSLVVEPVK